MTVNYASNINSLPVPLPKDINDPSFLPALNRILIGLQNNINSNNIINGSITANKIKSIDATQITGTIPVGGLDVADQGWIQTCNFAVVDADTVSWGAGTFKAVDGTTYSIGAGNTGNMVARTFIYLDIAVSVTAYQTTTNILNCIGLGKVMITTAINGAVEAEYLEFNSDQMNINASKIVAGSVTANEIAASTITGGKIAANTIQTSNLAAGAISADKITAGTFTTAQLLANGDFEDWNAGIDVAPDNWVIIGTGAVVGKVVDPNYVKLGLASCGLTRIGHDCYLYQQIDLEKGIAYWKGRTVTFSCWAWSNTASASRLIIGDDIGYAASSYHTGDSTWQLLTVTYTINANAAYVNVQANIDTHNSNLFIDGAMCVEGSYAMSYAPSYKNTIREWGCSPSAFKPASNTMTFTLSTNYLASNDLPVSTVSFYAPVSLPNGSIVTKLDVHYSRTNAGATGILYLIRTALSDGSTNVTMASITFTGTGGYATLNTTSITDGTIDNNLYSYQLQWVVKNIALSTDCVFTNAVITYTAPAPLS